APGRILVRAEDAPRAAKLLDELLDEKEQPKEETASTEGVPPVASPDQASSWWEQRTVGLALSTLAGLVLLWIALSPSRRVEPVEPEAKKATLEVVAVNDTVNPFEGVGTDGLPPAVTISRERMTIGIGKQVDVHFATTLPREGETWEQARTR